MDNLKKDYVNRELGDYEYNFINSGSLENYKIVDFYNQDKKYFPIFIKNIYNFIKNNKNIKSYTKFFFVKKLLFNNADEFIHYNNYYKWSCKFLCDTINLDWDFDYLSLYVPTFFKNLYYEKGWYDNFCEYLFNGNELKMKFNDINEIDEYVKSILYLFEKYNTKAVSNVYIKLSQFGSKEDITKFLEKYSIRNDESYISDNEQFELSEVEEENDTEDLNNLIKENHNKLRLLTGEEINN